jgi:hypothetical protein
VLPAITAKSASTDDPEVIAHAREWIDDCLANHPKCRSGTDAEWHPSRLLDLSSQLVYTAKGDTVRLVSRKDGVQPQSEFQGQYMTLSHRWGQKALVKLTRDNIREFMGGIPLSTLPKTFRDAIKVASSLGVRWLWIDALCIIQEDKGLKDWLEESASMERVYTNSYCNISATSAIDSSEGLFHTRDMTWRWHETVTLNTKDLRRSAGQKISCNILDPFFWQRYIDDAPGKLWTRL